MRAPLRLLAALLAPLLAACGHNVDPPEPNGPTITVRAFAAVMTELAIARVELLPDTAAYRARMQEILAGHELTADQVRAFAKGYDGNEDVMGPIYGLERARLDSLFRGEARRADARRGFPAADTTGAAGALPGAPDSLPGRP